MKTWTAQLLYKTDLIIGEGALWHPRWRKFLYVDIEGKKVGRIDPGTKKVEDRNVWKRVGTVVPSDNGRLIVALQGSIEVLDFENDSLKELVKIESDRPDNRCNEGKCDAAGRLWIGTMHVDAKLHEGALYCYDGELKKVLDNTSVSNGICWTKDSEKMYYIDSFDYNVRAYDFDVVSGNISNERIVTQMTESGHLPDGMTIDTEGMLWVAIWGGGCVNRYDASSGDLIGKVIVDAPNVTACAFGGDNMQQLFITTARAGLDQRQLEQNPLSGSLFITDTGVEGAGVNFFKSKKL